MTDVGNAPRKFVFVLEQSLGHAIHGGNIERIAAGTADVDPTFLRVGPGGHGAWRALPGVRNYSATASWTTRAELSKRLRSGPVDALYVHTQVLSLMLARTMRTVPTVISMDATPANFDTLAEGYGHRRHAAPIERTKRSVNQRALARAGAVVAFSRWAADSVVDDYAIAAEKVHVIAPGVDLGRFRPKSGVRAPGPVRILFVGADFVRKGGASLVEAVRAIGNAAELDIVTADRPRIPDGVHARIHTGLTPASELLDLYRNADIFALPSGSECFGQAFAEAMACGLPIVGCRVGGVPDLLVDGANGIFVPVGAADPLAETLKRLITSPGLRREMGNRGAKMARDKHDVERNTAAVLDLMRRMGRAPTPVPLRLPRRTSPGEL